TQIPNLMLYPAELSVVQTTGIEPATSGFLRRSATELGPRPISTAAPYAALAAPPARAEVLSSNRCAHRGRSDRERRLYMLRQTVASGIVAAKPWLLAEVAKRQQPRGRQSKMMRP